VATYCTISDLTKYRDDQTLANLAKDGNETASIDDSDVIAVLGQYITDSSNEVRAAVLGRVDESDSYVLADLRRLTVPLVLYQLYKRRGHYGPANPYTDDAKQVRKELDALRKGERSTGATATPILGAACTGSDKDPTFGDDSDGDTPSFMSDW